MQPLGHGGQWAKLAAVDVVLLDDVLLVVDVDQCQFGRAFPADDAEDLLAGRGVDHRLLVAVEDLLRGEEDRFDQLVAVVFRPDAGEVRADFAHLAAGNLVALRAGQPFEIGE